MSGRHAGHRSDARPPSTVASLLGFVSGAFVLTSMFLFLHKIDPSQRRAAALLLALLFEVVGALAMFRWRDRAVATAGVLVSAITVIPVLVFVFVDPKHPNVAFGSIDKSKGTITAILAIGAVLWLVAYGFAPVRRAGLFLVAALLSIWLVFLVQIATAGLDRASSFGAFPIPFNSSPSLNPDGTFAAPSPRSPTNALTKVALVSLFFGLAYLLLAVLADRRRDHRPASSLVGVALPVLTIGVLALGPSLHTKATSILGLVAAAIVVLAGATGGRRFTSWYGAVAAYVAITTFIANVTRSNEIAAAVVLLLLGIGAALAGAALDGWPFGGAGPAPAPSPAGPLVDVGAAPAGAFGGAPGWSTPAPRPTPLPPVVSPPAAAPPVAGAPDPWAPPSPTPRPAGGDQPPQP
ncbi:MAG: hypothetical protein JWN46_530 [Acidimicrobiales bacterium]|nr:hypothetical protein [Acidimicrobiales bacterium]